MKKLFVVLAMLVAMNASAQWVNMGSGMVYNDDITCIVVKDSVYFAGASNYLIAPEGNVYRSTNNCLSWTPTSLQKRTYCLTISANNIFAGTEDSGVYISTNEGVNWTQTSLNNKTVTSLVITGNNIFAGTNHSGIYLSTNNGTNWTQTSITSNRFNTCFAIDGNNIFAGGSGLYLTSDNGANWTNLGLNAFVNSIGIIGDTIYVGTGYGYGGLCRSTNYGLNFSSIFLFMVSVVNSIAIYNNNVFVGAQGSAGVIFSNNGINWINKNQGFGYNPPTLNALVVANNYIFAGDVGSTWRRSLTEIVSIQNISTETPSKYSLSQNYPNPFNPTTKIRFDIPRWRGEGGWTNVLLKIYDVMGREVQTLVNERLQPGTYETSFDGSGLNSGVYFYKMQTESFTETKRMVLIK